MRRPKEQAKLVFLGLLRTVSALAGTTESRGVMESSWHASWKQQTPQLPALTLRLARRTDVPAIQRCNLATLPENYNAAFYTQHLRQWPELSLVVVEETPTTGTSATSTSSSAHSFGAFPGSSSNTESNVVAYVLGRIETRTVPVVPTSSSSHSLWSTQQVYQKEEYGHITSLAVSHDYRRQGLAAELMEQLHHQLQKHYRTPRVGLHVRQSNHPAVTLYQQKFGYEPTERIPNYYQDGEDGYYMVKSLPPLVESYQSRLPFSYQPGLFRSSGSHLGKLTLPRHVGRPVRDETDSDRTSTTSGSGSGSSEGELLNGHL